MQTEGNFALRGRQTMDLLTVQGITDVGVLLRTMADGVERGELEVGDERICCSDDVTAVVSSSSRRYSTEVSVTLRFSAQPDRLKFIAVEQELAHPGG